MASLGPNATDLSGLLIKSGLHINVQPVMSIMYRMPFEGAEAILEGYDWAQTIP